VNARDDSRSDEIARLTAELEKTKKDIEALRTAPRSRQETAGELAKKVEELTVRLIKLRGLSLTYPLLDTRPLLELPPTMPANFRCEVTKIAGDLVMLDAGIDSGLAVGTVLDVYRLEKSGAQYLGTVKVTSALNLFPKQAIVSFTPARKVALDKLQPEELPRKGDEVRSPETLAPEKK
jgi:hypothetical protein